MKKPERIQDERNQAVIKEIKAAMKANKDLRMHERCQLILLYLRGNIYQEISKITDRTVTTVFNYVR